jgi:D-glutamate N-acetyltransferase
MRYRPDDVVCVLDSQTDATELEGFPLVRSLKEAQAYEPTTALVGVATSGGRFPPEWRALLADCVRGGLDVENGLHEFLSDDRELADLAALHGVELRDLRRAPPGLSVPTGANLTHHATSILMVGSDCAIGKMTVALELDREARARGIRSEFVPTGQTGIAIAGWGISVDAVVADFIAGAAEQLVLEGVRRGGDVLFVEGQGSLLNPLYSGVTMGLLHGSAPHAYVLCHKPGQRFVEEDERFPIPPLSELVELHERVSLIARPARVLAVALNTRDLDENEARRAVAAAEGETGLPATDPVRFGAARLVDALAPLLAT